MVGVEVAGQRLGQFWDFGTPFPLASCAKTHGSTFPLTKATSIGRAGTVITLDAAEPHFDAGAFRQFPPDRP